MAVYTDVGDEELDAFLAGYDLGALLSYKGIAEGVENSNFLLHTEHGQFHPDALREARGGGGPAVLPRPDGASRRRAASPARCRCKNATGEALGKLAGRPAAIVTFLDGMWMRRPRRDALRGGRRGAGAAASRRRATFRCKRANALSVDGWRPLFEQAARARRRACSRASRTSSPTSSTYLESDWPRGLPEGVIHADLFPDNVFFLGDKLSGLIDFYFACNDTLAYDVAICLNAWCFEPDHSFNVTKGRALLQGYAQARAALGRRARGAAAAARGAALRFLLTRLDDWLNVPPGALVRPKDPLEYLRKLRFHQARQERCATTGSALK